MRISIFPALSGASVESVDASWDQFAQQCLNPPTYPSKLACPLVKLATFGNIRSDKGSLRHEANMLDISGIEADYDGELISPEDARDMLALSGIESVIYTSPSHTEKAPRWRVLAPLAANAPLSHRRELVGRLNAALGGILAAESFTNAQTFFAGRVQGAEYICYLTHGVTIDTLTHLAPVYPVKAAPVPVTGMVFADRVASTETLAELQSALVCLDANDYDTWIAVGNACKTLGDEAGFPIWDKWSSTSPKYEPARWNTFNPERTGFTAIFARAARNGWVNPKSAGAPVDTVAVFAAIESAPDAFKPEMCSTMRLTSADQQIELFQGCVYITSTRQMSVPYAPYLVDKLRFDEMREYAGRSFIVNQTNQGAPEKSAWQAYLQSQIISWPRASTWCFRPECLPNSIIEEEGEKMVNLWRNINTARRKGDATPFINHIKKLLPVQPDADMYISYLAGMVQHPGSKFRYCFVMQGAKGNGKSFFGSVIGKALGNRYVHYPNSADIANKFNAWMGGKLCIVVEEICTQDKRETLEILKPMITNPRIELQGKGVNQVTGDNRANFLMFVNEQGSLPTSDNERRYAICHTAQQTYEDMVRDGMGEGSGYFSALWNWAENGGWEIITDFLATYPIPDEFNPTLLERAPRTSSFADAVTASLSRLSLDIIDAVENGVHGFCGGWLASHTIDQYLRESGKDRFATRTNKRDMIAELGYITHPQLFQGGRISNPIKGSNPPVRPVLYLKKNHPALKLIKPSEILDAFLADQPGYSHVFR